MKLSYVWSFLLYTEPFYFPTNFTDLHECLSYTLLNPQNHTQLSVQTCEICGRNSMAFPDLFCCLQKNFSLPSPAHYYRCTEAPSPEHPSWLLPDSGKISDAVPDLCG